MIPETINQFSFGGRRSYDDMDLIITAPPVFTVPERDVSCISVPGRSGDVITDNGRYKNITGTYKVAVLRNEFSMETTLKKIQLWLAGSIGYSVLSDTYDPQYYRLARLDGKLSFEDKARQIGIAAVKFNCKPYKYRVDGTRPILLSGTAGSIYNPEQAASTPYIKITGNGTITLSINHSSFRFENVDGYIEIDSDIMAVYKGTMLQNQKTRFTEFPVLEAGENAIDIQGDVSGVEILPRWCSL